MFIYVIQTLFIIIKCTFQMNKAFKFVFSAGFIS